MSVFADSSALVKLYAEERFSDEMRALPGPIAVSAIARVEVPAALWRKHRIGDISAQAARDLTAEFEADLLGTSTSTDPPRFVVASLAGEVLDRAAELLAVHDLRAYDAIQLATALAVKDVDPECSEFACFDARLSAAGALQGLEPVPKA